MKCYTNIPVLLCQYALVNRKVNSLKLYIYLKLSSDGYVINDKKKYGIWAETIGVTKKTVKSSLKWLIANKWITVNGKRNALKIIGYNSLMKKMSISTQAGYLLDFNNKREFQQFGSLCCGVVLIYYLKKKAYNLKRSERMKECSNMNRKQKGFYPMAISYLARCLTVSDSTAYRYMRKAHEGGYIDIKSNLQFLETKAREYIKNENYALLVSECGKENLPNKYRKGKSYIKQIEATLIRSNLSLKRKKLKGI